MSLDIDFGLVMAAGRDIQPYEYLHTPRSLTLFNDETAPLLKQMLAQTPLKILNIYPQVFPILWARSIRLCKR